MTRTATTDNLARVETKGGYWRWAHDGWLETVYADCAHHGLRVAREITGLFRSAIPLPGDARPGPVELKLASLGPVQPLVVGHYGEMGGYVDELLELAADAGADKHWQSMRCRDPDTARGIILQVLRRSWGMAAFRENARLIVRRLGRVGDARASATIRNSESTHRRLRRIYENAAEHYRCVTTSGKHGRRH